jgi:hypothetical protein
MVKRKRKRKKRKRKKRIAKPNRIIGGWFWKFENWAS